MIKTRIYEIYQRVRAEKPLIHHITNWVTIYDCANIVKVFGASPVMAHAPEEAADMASLSSALVLNMGTLTTELVESMKKAAMAANQKGIPVVLDVCGAGATLFRDKKCAELLSEVRIDVIKGNQSEVARVYGEKVSTKGVDSGSVSMDIAELARSLAKKQGCTVVVTGKKDFISDGKLVYAIENGHPVMAEIVGTGCMSTSIVGAFVAVEKDRALAAAAGLCVFEIVCELAAKRASGLGKFKEKIFDVAPKLNKRLITKMAKVKLV